VSWPNGEDPEISSDGRFVAFDSEAPNLVAGDTNGVRDVFVRDRVAGTTERVSVTNGGAQANGESLMGAISSDGRFVAFDSEAPNLVAGDTNRKSDVFVRDRVAGTTERVSIGRRGAQANEDSSVGAISADGRFVAFESDATNLVAGGMNQLNGIFVRDRVAGTTERVSVASGGAPANNDSSWPWISADGRFVVFDSFASNLVVGDTNRKGDVFVRDRAAGTTERVSVATGGAQANDESGISVRAASADGRFVGFESDATNLVAGDTNGVRDVFVRDRVAGTTERVDIGRGGAQANLESLMGAISADGRFVVFDSEAPNLVADDTNGRWDVFVRDRVAGTTERASVANGGAQANDGSDWSSISADGRFVAFGSDATNLVVGDTNR
jgi:Tol biopolymer transport system component